MDVRRVMVAMSVLAVVAAYLPSACASTSESTTEEITTPVITTTTVDPVRCNGDPPPQGTGVRVTMLGPQVVTYTCSPGFQETGKGAAIIHCTKNNTVWSDKKALECEPIEPEGLPPWLFVFLVALASSLVFIGLGFLVAYSCGLCCGCCRCRDRDHSTSDDRQTSCWSRGRHSSRVGQNPVHVTQNQDYPIIMHGDYLVKQKEFL